MTKPDVMRAAKLTRIPGVTIAEACKRFGVSKADVSRARKANEPDSQLSIAELALASLTSDGSKKSGTLGDLARIADYIDFVNKDACTADEVRAILATFEASGQLAIDGDRWTLLRPWP
jgi:hypothetical protein